MHIASAFDSYHNIGTPGKSKKLILVPSDNYNGMDRPFHEIQDISLRWFDHWLKGNDTGIMDEPPILMFVQGINMWRYEKEWPLPKTLWTKFYLREGGKLSNRMPRNKEKPGIFVSDPWANPNQGFDTSDADARADPVPKLIYETDPLSQNLEVTGPIALYWHAAIESRGLRVRSWQGSPIDGTHIMDPITNDTDWYLKVKDIDVDGSERCVSEGWLKASHYEIDDSRSKPYAPYHPHTRNLPIKKGEIIRYASDVRMTSNVFLTGHKIRLEIAAQDQVQATWYHPPHMAEVKHTIYSTRNQPSYLLLPVIPKGYRGAGNPRYPPAGPFRYPKYRKV